MKSLQLSNSLFVVCNSARENVAMSTKIGGKESEVVDNNITKVPYIPRESYPTDYSEFQHLATKAPFEAAAGARILSGYSPNQ